MKSEIFQFVVIHILKGFSGVNEGETDVSLEFSCFFYDPTDVSTLISGSSAFSKSSLNICKFSVCILLKSSLENFEHYFASMWDECNCAVVWTFFGIAFLWIGVKTDLSQSCGHCRVSAPSKAHRWVRTAPSTELTSDPLTQQQRPSWWIFSITSHLVPSRAGWVSDMAPRTEGRWHYAGVRVCTLGMTSGSVWQEWRENEWAGWGAVPSPPSFLSWLQHKASVCHHFVSCCLHWDGAAGGFWEAGRLSPPSTSCKHWLVFGNKIWAWQRLKQAMNFTRCLVVWGHLSFTK